MICGIVAALLNCFENLALGTGRHYRLFRFGQMTDYLYYLLGCFTLAENDLGETFPDIAMRVDFGKAEILVGKTFENMHGLIDIDPAVMDILEKLFYTVFVHCPRSVLMLSTSFKLPERKPCKSSATYL